MPKIRLLLIWFGANDSVLPSKVQYVPLDDFKTNLAELARLVTSPESEYHNPDTRVILLTPPPVNTQQRGADLSSRNPPQENDRAFENTAKYAEAVREVARQEKLPIVDVYSRLWEGCGKKEGNLTKYLTDGLHVNEDAYKVRRQYFLQFTTIVDILQIVDLQGHHRNDFRTLP